ncbi:MAG: glycosyltransferase family 9 protein [Bacteroidetes bacterium]|jgi:heptosyltransferase-2|nr:glycosyltransferase family 9 protein [Bacteroidota bacterium]
MKMNVLVIQTAFLGDVILTTPLFDALARAGATVDVVAAPAGSQVLHGHRSLSSAIVYDKKGNDRGLRAFLRLSATVRFRSYDVALVPHRSVRSALLARLAMIPRRIGFDRSAGAWSFTDVVRYRPHAHEIERNLDLLAPLGIGRPEGQRPSLSLSGADTTYAKDLLTSAGLLDGPFVAIAPGSVWNTKRWPEDRFARLVADLSRQGVRSVLIGGRDDAALCDRIAAAAKGAGVLNAAGGSSVLASAALIEAASVLVTNDSAPLHLASAVGTPIVALFGATSPSFGFGPRGPHDFVVETDGLPCRPCAIHGGDRCPIGTFDCMLRIEPERVSAIVLDLVRRLR